MTAKTSPAPARDEADGESSVRAVDRAVAILTCFTPDRPSMSVMEIQKRIGLSRPTLYRLLQTLVANGMMVSEGDPQQFRLAHSVLKLAQAYLSGINLVEIAGPHIAHLRDVSGETAALFVPRDAQRLCVLEHKSRHVLAISRGVGELLALHQGASGRAMLAFMSEPTQNAHVAGLNSAERAQVGKLLKHTRDAGFARSCNEVIRGAVAIAAPIFDHSGEAIGSVGLFGPTARLSDHDIDRLAPDVMNTASAISAELGFVARPAQVTPHSKRTGRRVPLS
ncbi:IclR family transcriptional regulator [Aquabacter spiritensis]|uniref:IclR family transcriptional regulator n=1 Tax=Aquabacter spiritensis TaxID=933073 RepID=A0A4R3LNW1_9HYPH|nr:IclR family transcriptional regulator [Aquabacter spiritensis]TCT02052.1 IclR family transcriptional regulator [Aquabacter spiritensis]